jgi:hypothetical protein
MKCPRCQQETALSPDQLASSRTAPPKRQLVAFRIMQKRKAKDMKASRWLVSILAAFAIFSAAPFASAQNAAVVMACASVPHPTTPNGRTFVVNQYDQSPGAPDIVLFTTSCATALAQLFDAGFVLVSVRETASGPAFTLVRPRETFGGTS